MLSSFSVVVSAPPTAADAGRAKPQRFTTNAFAPNGSNDVGGGASPSVSKPTMHTVRALRAKKGASSKLSLLLLCGTFILLYTSAHQDRPFAATVCAWSMTQATSDASVLVPAVGGLGGGGGGGGGGEPGQKELMKGKWEIWREWWPRGEDNYPSCLWGYSPASYRMQLSYPPPTQLYPTMLYDTHARLHHDSYWWYDMIRRDRRKKNIIKCRNEELRAAERLRFHRRSGAAGYVSVGVRLASSIK